MVIFFIQNMFNYIHFHVNCHLKAICNILFIWKVRKDSVSIESYNQFTFLVITICITCLPITFDNPSKACFSKKKYILYVKSEKKLYKKRYYKYEENKRVKPQIQSNLREKKYINIKMKFSKNLNDQIKNIFVTLFSFLNS